MNNDKLISCLFSSLMVLTASCKHDTFIFTALCNHDTFISDAAFLQTWDFVWRVLVITSVSCIPLYILKYLQRKFSPPSYSKLT